MVFAYVSVKGGVVVVIYWGRSLLMFFEPLCKCSCWFSNILFITFHPITFISVYVSTFFKDMIFILWSHEDVFNGKSSFEVYRKPTHTDLYLQWHSHHTISSKYSVLGTLYHRAEKPSALAHSCFKRKNNISSKPSKGASTQHGPEQNKA